MSSESSSDNAAEREPRDVIEQALKSSGSRPFRVGLVLGAVVTIAIALLIIQNGESTQLEWLTFDFEAPLWFMLMLTLGAGAVVWETAQALWRRGRRARADRRDALREIEGADI